MIVGFESTGPYGGPLQQYLSDKPVKLVQVNPSHTRQLKNMCDNTPSKSDMKDPRVISDIIRLGNSITLVVPNGAAANLREFNSQRSKNIRDRTAHINRLKQLYFRLFPEFNEVIKDLKTKTGLYLLENYPTPYDYVDLKPEVLGKELKKISRGRHGLKEASALIELGKNSRGVKGEIAGIVSELKQILFLVKTLNEFIREAEDELEKIVSSIPENVNILSIKGIRTVTAAGIIGEVANFKKFRTQSELIKYAGLNICDNSSGKKKGERHISKVGRSYLRKLLFFASLNLVRKGGCMHDYYQERIDNGKNKVKTLIAVSRKLLCLIFALVRDNSIYIENYNKRNMIRKAA